ncbi:MAG: PilT/PilU family type 4a pilus ATPase [Candidatus Omnitrophota bacterium]
MVEIDSNEEDSLTPTKRTGEAVAHGSGNVQAPRQIGLSNSLNEILAFARNEKASDVHLSAQNPVIFRKFGHLIVMTPDIFSVKHIFSLLVEILPPKVIENFERTGDLEYVHTIIGYGRFRMTIMKQRNGLEVVTRLIPLEVPRFMSSGMPTSCTSLIHWSQGIILITGPAGCGKTTTLATLVEMINQRREEHIIVIEDPIEIVYEPALCQITQRQIKVHTLSQANAIRAALREDPDVLVVGELRDLSTIQLAVTAAETGHLVFATMNTVNSTQTISRLIDSFPVEEQQIIRNLLSESLRAVICQQLVPKKDGSGVVAAYEILMNTSAVSNHIRKGTLAQIENAIITGKSSGMILMSHSLDALVASEVITLEEAQERTRQIQQS